MAHKLLIKIGISVILLVSGGCTVNPVERPLYQAEAGPNQVRTVDPVFLPDPVHPRRVQFRIKAPADAGVFPVVVHSHGGFCTDTYDEFTDHWASHGYIVLAPYHPDSPNSADAPDMSIIVQRRLRDLTFTLDSMGELIASTKLQAQPDPELIAITGHSFGAGMALMKNGMYLLEEQQAPWSQGFDPRFDAGIYFSAPGISDEMPANGFDGVRRPFLATGGTLDKGRMDPPDGMSLADFRREAFMNAPPGDKYSLIIDNADHYLGGLICNPERGGDPDPEAVEILKSVTTAFLDSYLKDSAQAREFLESETIESLTERADFRQR